MLIVRVSLLSAIVKPSLLMLEFVSIHFIEYICAIHTGFSEGFTYAILVFSCEALTLK